MPLKTILVGVGGRGLWPVEVMGSDDRFEIAALCDMNADFLQSSGDKLNIPENRRFRTLTEALGAVESEAVVVCTPTKTHAPLSREAFAAGKHVLVEKGMTFEWNDALTMVREAEQAGVKFCVAQNYRYHEIESELSRILNDPADPYNPGKIAIVDMMHHRYRPEPRTLNYPFAMVWDMSCHHVDLLNGWLGPAKRVQAVSSNTYWSRYEDDANITAVIEYESGAMCNYILTHAATLSDYRLIMQGEKGALRTFDVPGLQFYGLPAGQLGSAEPVQVAVPPKPRSERGVAGDFLRYIQEGVEPGISGRNNLQTLAVCEMLVRSASQHRAVERAELMGEG